MRKNVAAVAEQDLPVGAVVSVAIDKVGYSRVGPKRLLYIVIEKVHYKYQLACRTGVLDNCLARVKISSMSPTKLHCFMNYTKY